MRSIVVVMVMHSRGPIVFLTFLVRMFFVTLLLGGFGVLFALLAPAFLVETNHCTVMMIPVSVSVSMVIGMMTGVLMMGVVMMPMVMSWIVRLGFPNFSR